MPKLIDLTGQKFNKWTVIKICENYKPGKPRWICECVCGKRFTLVSFDLKSGKSKGCFGCREKAKRRNDDFYYMWTESKHGAERRNIEFNISINDLKELFKKQNGLCALSGRPLNVINQMINGVFHRPTASIDRIDSSKGYIINNIQFVHKIINTMKMDFSQKEFIEVCKDITEFQRRK